MINEKLADLLRDCLSDYSHPNFTDRRGMADRIRGALQAHAAEAAQAQAAQAAEPVGFVTAGALLALQTCRNDEYNGTVDLWMRPNESVKANIPLYTRPQPAQDASKYQELLMAVEKKFPGESRHETALRYIRETELQSCEPKCDAAMAKESGR